MNLKAILFATAAGLLTLASAHAFVIPAPGASDVVHDFKRNRIYITSGDSVLRYDRATSSFLSPVTFAGAALRGIDLSPEGDRLAVADNTLVGDQVVVHVVDLNTLSGGDLADATSFMELGSFSVAWADAGTLLVTSQFNGSGWVRLRKFDVGTRTVQYVLDPMTQGGMLVTSADRSRIGFAEANISDGRWGRYTTATRTLEHFTDGAGTGDFNSDIGVNRDGSQVAIVSANGAHFHDDRVSGMTPIGNPVDGVPVGVAFHPVEPRVYFPWSGTNFVKIYDTTTLSAVASIPMSQVFASAGVYAYGSGRTKLSRDGSVLMVTVDAGVEVIDTPSTKVTTSVNRAVTFDLPSGSVDGTGLNATLETAPSHGVVTISGSSATYTPAADYVGSDLFTFAATTTTSDIHGIVSVNVRATPLLVQPKVDFDGNGRSDLAWTHPAGGVGYWLMDGTSATSTSSLCAGSGCVISQLGDFDGDGKTDVLYRNPTGAYVLQLMQGPSALAGTVILGAGSGWEVVAKGDFNGDGKTDLLWKSANGTYGMWLMDGTSVLGAGLFQSPGLGWDVQLVADFNGDGKSDILWRNADGRIEQWAMDGANSTAQVTMTSYQNVWMPLFAGDFDGDGKADIVWTHPDGSIAVWLVDGTTVRSATVLVAGNSGWHVRLVADLDGDGKSDIVLGHDNGAVGAWLMDGSAISSAAQLVAPNSGWFLVTSGDYDGDGRADLVWRDSVGDYWMWLMGGLAPLTVAPILSGGTGWSVVP